MTLRIFFIALLTLLVDSLVVHASDDEIRQKKAVFVLEDFQQWVDLKYQFADTQSNHGLQSSSSHQFQESYNGNLNLDILNPHLFNVNLSFSVGPEQDFFHYSDQGNSKGNSFRYTYQFIGTGLDRSITPFTIVSYRNSERVVTPFSPSYTTDATGQELDLALHNSMLPSSLTYSHKTLDNFGGGNDSSTVSDSFNFSTSHHYKDLSTTAAAISMGNSSGSFVGGVPQSARSYSGSLSNNLTWGPDKKYSLVSMVQLYDTIDQNLPQRNTNVSETFQDHLGRALDLQVNYALAKNSASGGVAQGGLNSQNLSTNQNSGELVLAHHLFDSVTTRFRAKVSNNDMMDGSEFRYSEGGDLTYAKRLPGDNHLTILISGLHEVIDNNFGSSVFNVIDESHPLAHQGDTITLNATGVLKSVNVVKSTNPTFIYTEGTDYVVDLAHAQILILRGGKIDPSGVGTDLLISYSQLMDPVLKYAANTFNITTGVTFQGGKYMMGGTYMNQWMELIHGSNQNSLRDSTLKMLYFNGNLNPLIYRVSYTDSLVGSLDSHALEATGQYIRDTTLGRLSLVGSERFSWYGASGTTPAYTENMATCSIVGIRNFYPSIRTTVSANVYDDRSDIRGAKDIVSLRGSILYTMNKMSISFDGQTAWNFMGGTTTRDDTVTVDFTRYF